MIVRYYMKRRIYSKVTRKGQVTIPAQARREMNIEAGDQVAFVMDGGKLEIERATAWVTQTAGILRGMGPVLTAEELDEAAEQAWADEAAERDERSKQR